MKKISIKKWLTLTLLLGWSFVSANAGIITDGWERSAKSVKGILTHLRMKNPNVSEELLSQIAKKLYQEMKSGKISRPKTKAEIKTPKPSAKPAPTTTTRGTTPGGSVGEQSKRYGSASTLRKMRITPVSERRKPEVSEIQDEVEEVEQLVAEGMSGEVVVQIERDLSQPVTAADKWYQKAQEFVKENGRWPRSSISGKKAAEYTPEEREECRIGAGVNSAIRYNPDDPVVQALIELKAQYVKERATPKTPEEWLAEVQKFVKENGRWPRHDISGKKAVDYTPEEAAERHIRGGVDNAIWNGDPNSDTIQALIKLKEQYLKQTPVAEKWLAEAQKFVEENGRWPRSAISGKKAADYTPEEREECRIGAGVNNTIKNGDPYNDPIIRALIELKAQYVKEIATPKTPEEWLAEVQKFVKENERWPRHDISGKKAADYTPEEAAERHIRGGVDNAIWNEDPNSDTIQALIELKEQYATQQTPEEWLREVQKFVEENERWPRPLTQKKAADLTPEESAERRICHGVNNAIKNNPDDPVVQALIELKAQYVKEYATQRTPEEWLREVQNFVKENGRWPRQFSRKKTEDLTPEERAERQIYAGVDGAIKRNPDDPVVQALIELKEQYVKKYATRQTP